MKIGDRLFLSIQFDGVDFPLETNGFQYITMVENSRLLFATCELVIQDMSGLFGNKISIGDSTPIKIIAGTSETNCNTYNFRIFSSKRGGVKGVPVYVITGYTDSPDWVMGSQNTNISGTSDQALQQLATQCHLGYSGTPATYKMLWMAKNDRRCVYASRIASQGYFDDYSCMVMGVGIDSVLRYKNLGAIQITDSIPIITRGTATANQWQAVDARSITSSGRNNAIGGYSQATIEQTMLRKGAQFNSINVKLTSEVLNLDRSVQQYLGRTRIEFGPLDCGNVPTTFEKGIYQNSRTSRMYTTGYEVLIQMPTPFKMFDVLKYVPIKEVVSDTDIDQSNVANYILFARTIKISIQNYGEKLTLLGTGDSSSVNNQSYSSEEP